MLTRTLSRARSLTLGSGKKTSRRSAHVPPRTPSKAALKARYGEHASLFEKELPPHIKYYDPYDKHKQLIAFEHIEEFYPKVEPLSFVAPNATLAGNVEVWNRSSIWYGVSIRGDTKLVRIGQLTNIQDNTTITEALGPLSAEHDGSTIIGHWVTIGHSCHLSACTIEERCLVGMGSILCPDSYMEAGSMLAAHSVLPSGARVPSGQLWAGNPARYIRDLTEEEIDGIKESAIRYWKIATEHEDEFHTPIGTNYIEAQKIDASIGWRLWESTDPKLKGL